MLRSMLFSYPEAVDGYLYVPFTEEEMGATFEELIEKFRDNFERSNKDKTLEVAYYGSKGLIDLPKKAKVYVLAHGTEVSLDLTWPATMPDPVALFDQLKAIPLVEWPYAVTSGKKAISIDTIALRMIEDGLLASDQITIKLWFCDLTQKALAIAEKFSRSLKNSRNTYRIDYYPNQSLSIPLQEKDGMHKRAKDSRTQAILRASCTRYSLFFCEDKKDCSYTKDLNRSLTASA